MGIKDDLKAKGYFIAEIDGRKCPDFKSFLVEIGIAFRFPDYYGVNINALWDCINDLDWIEAENYYLGINNFNNFLGKESIEMKSSFVSSLLNVRKEWGDVPNYVGEEAFRNKADFVIELKH